MLSRRPLAGRLGGARGWPFRIESAGVFLAASVCAGACGAWDHLTADPGHGKRGLDLSRLDEDGLYGPADGLRALDYEFCIPDSQPFREEVRAIDPSAWFPARSPGRVGCRPGEALVLGNTHQPSYRKVLSRLEALPYVDRIVPAWFE